MKVLFALLAIFASVNSQAPIISRVRALNQANINSLITNGGETLVVDGSNFGLSNAKLTYLGPSPFTNGVTIKYSPPIIQQNNTNIIFTTSPGIGGNLQFVVETASLVSVTSPAVASYAAPTITNITTPSGTILYSTQTLRPQGTDTVIINGYNFGPRSYPGFPTNVYTPTVRFGGLTGTYGWMNSCIRTATAYDRQITCRVPVGGGTNHTVRMQSGVTGQWSAINLKILISYVTPTVVSTSPTIGFLNTAGFEQIVIRGTNMPYPSWVIAGYCVITASFGPYVSSSDQDKDRSGSDLTGSPIILSPTANVSECARQCSLTPLCKSWALRPIGCGTNTVNSCWLKSAVPKQTSATCVQSGFFPMPPFKYSMRACTGAFDTDGKTPVITCQTPVGTGTGYALSVNVANLYTNILANRVIGYSPPIIYSYSGKSVDADTIGNETVLINGMNFGYNNSMIKAQYTLNLKQITNNLTDYTYVSPFCNITINHTQLGCVTVPGVGRDLTWSVQVDSQNSVNPKTGYKQPQIIAYTIHNKTTGLILDKAPTIGGDILYIIGSGFGPPNLNLIQTIYVQSAFGTLTQLTIYNLISDSLITAPLPPGGGQGWQALIQVADVLNEPSSANFSYANPSVIQITPNRGPTMGSTTVKVQASNLALDYMNIVTVVVFGNTNDNSLYPQYINTNLLPRTDNDTSISTPFVPGFLTFIVPPGIGSSRQISLLSYLAKDSPPELTTLTQPITNNQDLFSYDSPIIISIVLSLPQTPNQIQFANNFFGTITNVRVLTLYGTNFGLGTYAITRSVEYLNNSVWSQSSDFFFDVTEWLDTTITFYTQITLGSIRIKFQSLDPLSNPINTWSNAYAFNDLSPFIFTDNSTQYPTTGNAILTITAMYLSAASSLNITVSSINCPILDPDTLEPLSPQDIYNRVINNPSQHQPPGPFTPNTQWTVRCLLPQGQGSTNPLILYRYPDQSPSQPLYVSYIPPIVSSMNFVPEFSQTRIMSPSLGTSLDIYGSNLGPCPNIIIATYTINTCIDYPGSINSQHTHITVQIPPGEGNGTELSPPLGWTVQLFAGDQGSTAYLFSWNPPQIDSISAPSYPTEGATTLTIQGKDFGQSLPLYPQSVLPPQLQVIVLLNQQPCINTVRLSHTIITCELPEGSGFISANLFIAGQQSTNTIKIQYDPPQITNLGYNTTINATIISPTTGVPNFYLIGKNFGPSPSNSCIFITNENTNGIPFCNGLEDYPGEGELWTGDIKTWNHTHILFNLPPGTGYPILHITASGIQLISSLAKIIYASPNIDRLSLSVGPSLGNYPVSLYGMGFGSQSDPTNTYPILLPLSLNQRYFNKINIIMEDLCISSAQQLGCQPLLLTYQDRKIDFTMPPGIGANLSFKVLIVTNPNVESETKQLWSYNPPEILSFNPNPVYIGLNKNPQIVLTGNNLGTSQVFNLFPKADPTIIIKVDNTLQSDPTRIQRNNIDVGIQFTMQGIQLTAGYKTAEIKIANQWGSLANTSFLALAIFCETNYFAYSREFCFNCPIGSTCNGGLTYPTAMQGFFNLNSSLENADPCPQSNIIQNADNTIRDICIVPCSPPEACIGNNACAYGYTSIKPAYRCNSCQPGFYKPTNTCIKCPDSPIMLVIGVLFIIAALSAAGYFLNKYSVNMAFVSIAIDYFQVISIFLNSKIQWPPVIKNLMYVLSAFNLNIDIVAPECLVPNVSYEFKFYFIMGLPLAIFALFFTGMSFMMIYKSIMFGRKRKELFKHKSIIKATMIILMYFFYLYLTRTIMDVFNCTTTVPPSYDKNGSPLLYMSVIFEQCNKPGGLQMRLQPISALGLTFYSLGFPAILAYALWSNKELIMLDQLLRSKNNPNDRFNNPHAYDVSKSYSRIYYQFKPHFFYWSLMILIRKFFIAISSVVFASNSAFQMAACLLILFLAYSAQTQFRPFMCYDDYISVQLEHKEMTLCSPIHQRIQAIISSVESKNIKIRKKHVLNEQGKIDKTALFRAIGSWVFNYNTVESTMLFSGVIVCLMGLMYQSSTSTSDSARDSITGVILTVITSSILYLSSVFAVEIYIALQNNKTTKNNRYMRSHKDEKTLRDSDTNVSTETNPIMLSKNIQSQFNITEFDDPPPKEIWQIFKSIFEKQQSDMNNLVEINMELKKYRQQTEEFQIELTSIKKPVVQKKEFQSLALYSSRSLTKAPLQEINETQ